MQSTAANGQPSTAPCNQIGYYQKCGECHATSLGKDALKLLKMLCGAIEVPSY